MNVQSRLMHFISSKRMSISDFERICDLSNGYVHKIKNSVGKRGLCDIQRKFPELNTDWLLTGEGEMLNPSIIQNNRNGDNNYGHSVKVEKTTDIDKLLNTISDCHSLLQKKDEQIDRLLTLLENSRN